MLLDIRPPDFRPRCTTVGCAILHGDQVLLLLRAAGVSYPNVWAYPAGKVEPDDEDIWAAMTRELVEETGIAVFAEELTLHGRTLNSPRPLLTRFDDGVDFEFHMFSVRLYKKPTVWRDKRKHSSELWVPCSEVGNLNCIDDTYECLQMVLRQRQQLDA